jgi:glycosyltransferase involved in cell wall biosynthesis
LKKKIAFIVQRYGLEVNGGAEYHCRVVAEKLKDLYDIEILTSCAKGYVTWENEYPEGITNINGIAVHRFPVDRLRGQREFRSLGRKIITKRKPYQKLLRFFGLLDLYEKAIPEDVIKRDEMKWIDLQGPFLTKLINYLKRNNTQYDALIFFTYLYYPTIYGVKVAPEKSILIPTAHDEPAIYMRIFKELFNIPAAILYNTISEKKFVNRLTGNTGVYSDVVGVGIEKPKGNYELNVETLSKTGDNYLLYIGRVDIAKGCKMLIEYFLQYKTAMNKQVKLVLAGEVFIKIPGNEDIVSLGFVDEDVKIALLANAKALVIPSLYESLSLVTLESMAYGIPVIANEKCEVLKDHIENSHSGFLFNSYESFKPALDAVLNPDFDITAIIANGKKYVAENYTWDVTIQKYKDAIAYVSRR